MLVIVSDLHFTDGTTGKTISSGAFKAFARRLGQLAVSASWRDDDKYRPIEQIDVVLLGDVLDVMRSTAWTRGRVKPWSGNHSAAFARKVSGITNGILAQNKPALAVLKGLSAVNGFVIPRSFQGDKPSAETQVVPVRIFYMVGNHDWFYHLGDTSFNRIRKKLVGAMGLAHPYTKPFPYDAGENDELIETMELHNVIARHGDQFDPWNFDGDRDASSLGDAIVVELVVRFPQEVRNILGRKLPKATADGLREIDNVRPLTLIPLWIQGLLQRTCSSLKVRDQVKNVWNDVVDRFLRMKFVREHDRWFRFDPVDMLQAGLKISQWLSIAQIHKFIMRPLNAVGSQEISPERLHGEAMREGNFINHRARNVVYGHTHVAEVVPLDVTSVSGDLLEKMYFNSGTWRRVHQLAKLKPTQCEFVASEVMTYLAFFQEHERAGRHYEAWSGTLGHRT